MRRPGAALAGLLGLIGMVAPGPAQAHPMGNFSISHHAAIRVHPEAVELRYVVDLAEIPTFMEMQSAGVVAEADHPTVRPYLARLTGALGQGLTLELNGRRLALESGSGHLLFTPGAGDLPTMKVGIVYRAAIETGVVRDGANQLAYRDDNFPDRAGWKEVVAAAAPGVHLIEASVPAQDRSGELSDYPVDLLNSPPQDVEARLAFTVQAPGPGVSLASPPSAPGRNTSGEGRRVSPAAGPLAVVPSGPPAPAPVLRPNARGTPRDAFTALVAIRGSSAHVLAFAALVAAALGALHALEPGHGKTVVAAYLVGSRGTARHALALGLIVTASHTAAVYLLGGVTLYASRYVLPERLYPWLGASSGAVVAILGLALFLKRYAGASGHGHAHTHHPGDPREHEHARAHGPHAHSPAHGADAHGSHGHGAAGRGHRHAVSVRELLALGITGGVVPCPAALVVLLSAVALQRVGFGLFLIAAFSAGLAAVLIAVGLLMVYARRAMARFTGEGRLITRWLPLASSAAIAVLGVVITLQALATAGIVRIGL